MNRVWRMVWFGGALGLFGCKLELDEAESVGDDPTGSIVGAEWRSFCVATFTEDYQVLDLFGDADFVAHPGEEYLLAAYGDEFAGDTASLLYVTSAGPYAFEVVAPTGTRDFPFMTNCTFGATTPYYAAFGNVSLYAEDALTTKLCDLQNGNVVPLENTNSGYGAVSIDFFGPSTYEIFLNGFGAQCGGATSGFVSVPQVALFGSRTWLVPIRKIVGPN